jgi:hypothetical protein
MTSTSLARSKAHADLWPSEPSVDAMIHPTDLDRIPKRRSFGRRALHGLARFVIVFCIGGGATLAWQSYGDTAREMIANSSPQLTWLAPQTAALAQTVPTASAPTTPATNVPQLTTMSLDLAAMRQGMDQLAVRQQQVADAIAKLQVAEQDILAKIAAPPPQPTAAPTRKPVALTPQPSSQAPPVR